MNNGLFFFDYFLKKYFSLKFKKNVFFYVNDLSISYLDTNKFGDWFNSALKKISSSFFNYFLNFNSLFLKSFISFLLNKDVLFFSLFLKKFFLFIYYKNHKKLLVYLKFAFFFFFKYLKSFLNFKGIKFKMKGKISLGGNSKKKSFSFSLGQFSKTRKNLFFNYNKDSINTISGLLGYFIFIFF